MARCNHPSLDGVDQTPLENPRKVWRCRVCGGLFYCITGADGLSFYLPAPHPDRYAIRKQLAESQAREQRMRADMDGIAEKLQPFFDAYSEVCALLDGLFAGDFTLEACRIKGEALLSTIAKATDYIASFTAEHADA